MAESKSMDVAKAGKSTPDATGRPVIVGHRPLLKQDPMVNASEPQTEIEKKADEKPPATHGEKVIAPPSAAATPEKQPESPATETPASGGNSDEQPVSDDGAVVDAVAEQAGVNKKKPGELTEEEKKRQDALDELIEEKKYFIPIKVASRKRKARSNIVILAVLLLAVAGYLLVDSGVLTAPFSLPIHVFKQKDAAQQTSVAPTPQPAAVKPALSTYKSTTDPTFSFQYPASWQITVSKPGQTETASVIPPLKTGESTPPFAVAFVVGGVSPINQTGNTIKDVKYTDITSSAKKKLYLREVVYADKTGVYNIRLSVTEKKDIDAVGGSFTTNRQTFSSLDGKTQLSLEEMVNHTDTSKIPAKLGFDSLQTAQTYMTTQDYKDSRSILLSAKFE